MRLRCSYLGPALLLFLSNQGTPVAGQASGSGAGLYPPGLLPVINKANALLSTGNFGEAARMYGEAIEQSPSDYLLYYKRATAYLSLQRHQAALEDFDKVLSLTQNTFDNAHLQKARILLKEGEFTDARHSLSTYLKAKKGVRTPEVEEVEQSIEEGDKLKEKVEKERRSQLWTACVETASQALRHASHSLEVRVWRAECALGSGDVESSLGDLSRLSHLLPPSTELLTHIFRLSYFLLPHSSIPSPSSPKEALKQCIHYDPDSKPCLTLHRLLKKLDRGFTQLDDLLVKEDWRGIVKLLIGPGGGKNGDLYTKFEDARKDEVQTDKVLPLVPPKLLQLKKRAMPAIQLPDAEKTSLPRQHLVRSLCKAYSHLADTIKSKAEYKSQRQHYCTLLLSLSDCSEDVDGLVGKAESLLSESEPQYEEAVRLFDRAFEKGGRSDRNVHERLTKAQRLLKQSRSKDYYKIVGVDRGADDKTIKKAFRKAAKFAHPDKGGSEEKMAALNEAYEVLSNPELRQRFDAGEDPMDPQAQQGQPFPGGDPFAQFFGGQGSRRPFAGPGGFQYQHGGGAGGGFHFSHGF